MKKLTVKNKLVHVDVFIFHIDNNLTDLKHHFKYSFVFSGIVCMYRRK